MGTSSKKVKGIGLCSGGLDSILSALVLRSQGIDVEWISFETPFFAADKAKKASFNHDIPLTVKNITPAYLKMLKNPHCGYGKNMNPCLDCHTLMFNLAGRVMEEQGFHFLFSGEVAGQRPMSQTKSSLRYVEKNSGYDGYILRPLSALTLPETAIEAKGLVDRSRLLKIVGRGRKDQIRLAQEFGVTEYPAPAGGCLLTDKGYSIRLADLFEHQDHYSENELHLLKYGRHLRLDPKTKIIVGRTKHDNDRIIEYANPSFDMLLRVKDIPGPVALIPRSCGKDHLIMAASICVGYSKAPNDEQTWVVLKTPSAMETLRVTGKDSSEIQQFIIK
ncbi:tRNA 4-thiouridine(8) synthase ThiI [Desulfobacterales bacterium HSG16]|nr:tRNA 4-thiouridine(8) synthase ThiI [Desulfobacterales bacterium HSG16]